MPNKNKLPREFIDFLDTLIYSLIIDMENKENQKSLKNISTHFKEGKKFGREFYYGYYTGLLVVIITFTFSQKYGREPNRNEFDEILDIISEKSKEIENALIELNIGE